MRVRKFDKELSNELMNMIKNKRLIPVIGAGFTAHCPSRNGFVPNGKELMEYMNLQLEKQCGSSVKGDFSRVAGKYDKFVSLETRNKYLENNFIDVQVDEIKQEFLNIDWPYMYTLNIDDAIELANREFKVILANKEPHEDYIKENKCLFKLHGDANDVLKYQKSDQKIFTQREYIKSLKSNRYLLDLFKNDYISKNIIFIGCSLDDEVDLLSAIIDSNGKTINKIYYLTHEELNDFKIDDLEEFGVTDIIKINNINEYEKVYKKFIEIYNESKLIQEDELSKFENLNVEKITDKSRNNNLPYLFEANKIMEKLDEKKIVLPYYYIERNISNTIIKQIDDYSIHMIVGDRVSGKTFCLVNILDRIVGKNTYYISSDTILNNNALGKILDKKDSVILFDSKSIKNDQFKYITDRVRKFKENNTIIIIAINSSDKDVILNIKDIKRSVNIKELKSKFTDLKNNKSDKINEINEINNKLSLLDIQVFDKTMGLLDNIIRLDKIIRERGEKNYSYSVPKLNRISKMDLVILILLATKERVTSHDINVFNLVEDIVKFEQITEPATNFNYTNLYEDNDHSGYKVIANAKYWILETLGEYSICHKYEIAQAYKHIAKCLENRFNDERKFFKEMSNFIKFDVLNSIFVKTQKKGAGGLINKIYEELHDYMCNDPQYFHQRAKSIYWLNKKNKEKLEEALILVDKSKNDIEVIGDLTKEKVKSSLSHIEYTKALIMGRICSLNYYNHEESIKRTIEAYYKAFLNPRNSLYTSYINNESDDYKVVDLKNVLEAARNNRNIKREFSNEIGKLYEVLLNK